MYPPNFWEGFCLGVDKLDTREQGNLRQLQPHPQDRGHGRRASSFGDVSIYERYGGILGNDTERKVNKIPV